MEVHSDLRATSPSLASVKHETPQAKRRKGRRGRPPKSPVPKTEDSPVLPTTEDVDMTTYVDDEEVSLLDEKLMAEMELEKELFPGASKWARDEERLFELLFLRDRLPILPCHWEVDFRLFPMSQGVFSTKGGPDPIVYAHTKEFRATMALTRLIDLTANVRTAYQSSLRHKAPSLIRKALDKYIRWAAEDGGYSHLKVVPNMITEVIGTDEGEAYVVKTIESRMRDLARRQREYLRIDSADIEEPEAGTVERKRRRSSWREFGSLLMERLFKLLERSSIRGRGEPDAHDDMVAVKAEDNDEPMGFQQREQPKVKVKKEKEEEDAVMAQLPSIPRPPPPIPTCEHPSPSTAYRRTPPVVYGLFIVSTSVFLMTVDSSQADDENYVSFHVETDFRNAEQSIWNALTVAMVVCLARDEMMTRLDDFEEIPVVEESDPDA